MLMETCHNLGARFSAKTGNLTVSYRLTTGKCQAKFVFGQQDTSSGFPLAPQVGYVSSSRGTHTFAEAESKWTPSRAASCAADVVRRFVVPRCGTQCESQSLGAELQTSSETVRDCILPAL